jgi:hypothetical protein
MRNKDTLELSHLVGRHIDDVSRDLEEADISTSVVEHELPGPLALLYQLRPPPQVAPGDHVNVITSGKRIVGFEVDQAAALESLRARVERLERIVGGQE